MRVSIIAPLLGLAAVVFATFPAYAQDAIQAPARKTIGQPSSQAGQMVPSLAVLSSGGATLVGDKLTMIELAPTSIVFADRPTRAAGHVLTKDFIKQWGEGKDSFATDPPNATISVLNSDGSAVVDAVVVLKKPTLEGSTLTFDVSVLEGDLRGGNGPASLFIDWFAVRGGGFGRVGVGWRGGWYAHRGLAGAAVGAAAVGALAQPYYGAYGGCGYYPLPPC